ncbi:MAG: glycosyltransferase [Hellea sp.]
MSNVCVLLAAYNGQKYIEEQLDSILCQVDVNVDIYVSLDLSDDSSYDIIIKYANINSNILFLPYGKHFGSAGSNFFNLLLNVNFEKYDFISFADQDDIWFSNKLSESIFQMTKHQADAFSSNVIAFWPDGKEVLIKKDYKQTEYDFLFESSGPGCTFVIKTQLALSLKRFLKANESDLHRVWLHDWFCYSYARNHGFNWYICPIPLMKYRQHESNEVGANSGVSSLVERAKIVLSGDAFEKVLEQANFLEQNNQVPIQLIKKGGIFNFLKLAVIGHKCRRKFNDKIFFVLAILFLSLR